MLKGAVDQRRKPSLLSTSQKMCALNGVKNNQGQFKRKAMPLYDPGRPGGAGPPTRQPLCPVHRGLILICLCISLPCSPLPPWDAQIWAGCFSKGGSAGVRSQMIIRLRELTGDPSPNCYGQKNNSNTRLDSVSHSRMSKLQVVNAKFRQTLVSAL